MKINNIKAIRVLDSRGYPTLRTFVTSDNYIVSASVPSGTSSGRKEALEIRDKTKAYFGKDVTKAINNVNKIIFPKLKNKSVFAQEEIDSLMINLDNTENKSKLGSNAILSVSLAVAKAGALESGLSLYDYLSTTYHKTKTYHMPKPILNIINGGEHAGNSLSFQEFQIIVNEKKFEKSMQVFCEIYYLLKDLLIKKYGKSSINVGYEGGYAPALKNNEEALALITKAITLSKYKNVSIGLDCAANSFYNSKTKTYNVDNKKLNSSKLMNYYEKLLNNYNITSIEDPFDENDKSSWITFNKNFGKKINVIGDDLLVSNSKYIADAIKKGYCNSVLLKPNQIGTLTEIVKSFNLSKNNNLKTIISHRSGETEDSFISDLAYGLGSDFVKFGAPARGERTSKYNRLIEIEKLGI